MKILRIQSEFNNPFVC